MAGAAVKQSHKGTHFKQRRQENKDLPTERTQWTAYSTGHCLWAGLSVEGILRPDWWLNTIISGKFWLKDKTESGVAKVQCVGTPAAGADWDKVFGGIKQILGGACYVQVWSSGQLLEVCSLLPPFRPRDQTQVLQLGNKHPSHQTFLLAQENIVFNLEDNTTLTSDKTTILHFIKCFSL